MMIIVRFCVTEYDYFFSCPLLEEFDEKKEEKSKYEKPQKPIKKVAALTSNFMV